MTPRDNETSIPTSPTPLEVLRAELDGLAQKLIETICLDGPVREGIVMTTGEVPYRRVDCDGRALAYVRTRPAKRIVRVDVSGLWAVPERPPIAIPTAAGAATLVIRGLEDVEVAARFLLEAVRATRAMRGAA